MPGIAKRKRLDMHCPFILSIRIFEYGLTSVTEDAYLVSLTDAIRTWIVFVFIEHILVARSFVNESLR